MKFELKQVVRLVDSRDAGVVVGRAEYVNANPGYLIRFVGADGRQRKEWWDESEIEAA